MKTVLSSIFLVLMFGVSPANAKEVCGASGERYFDEGLIFHLSKAGVPYKRGQLKEIVCVDEKYSSEFGLAERELERYFHEVAYDPRSKCEEDALVRWATKEGLRFEINPVLDAQRRPRRSMFFLRSFTQDQVVSNRAKLASAVGMIRCST